MGSVDTVLVRMDRMGDLIVSLPADEHPAFGGQRVHWFITKGLGFVAEQSQPRRRFSEFSRKFSLFEFFRMVRWFKTNEPAHIVLLHCPWWVGLAAWFAGVSVRIGRRSQWHSYLFLNIGIRQKRSLSDRHESDYNFDLIEAAFSRIGLRTNALLPRSKETYLHLKAPNPSGTLKAKGLKARGYRVVHPGMGGSALNWPQDHYSELIEELAKDAPVIVTGTAGDQKFLTMIKERVHEKKNVLWMVGELSGSELMDILSQARSVVAPSTGVIHLAASLDTPTFGIYSPRRVEHPIRWGPRGRQTMVIYPPASPDVSVGPNVMTEIRVGEVLSKLHDLEKAARVS